MDPPSHPRVFVRYGKTKGEIWIKKGDFRGDFFLGGGVFEGFGVWELATPPTHIWENFPPRKRFFGGAFPYGNGESEHILPDENNKPN